MDLKYFEEQFNTEKRNPQETADLWNEKAKRYYEQSKLKADAEQGKRRLVDEWLARGVINENSYVLDVGCGPGNFTKLIAPYVKKIVGVDISTEMLKHAKENTAGLDNVEFLLMNWWDGDITALRGKFDLVIANMTPSIINTSTLYKLIECSKDYCFYCMSVYRTGDIKEKIKAEFGLDLNWYAPYYAFNILWLKGMHPEVKYVKSEWEGETEYKEALKEYIRQLKIPESEVGRLEKLLKPYVKDGKIVDKTVNKSAQLLWRVKDN